MLSAFFKTPFEAQARPLDSGEVVCLHISSLACTILLAVLRGERALSSLDITVECAQRIREPLQLMWW